MNLGAILRCAFYLGVDRVIVTAKNWLVLATLPVLRWLEPTCTWSLLWLRSCPLTPTVSKASSGAMEWMRVHSVKDMAKFFMVCSRRAVGVAFTFVWHWCHTYSYSPFLLPFPHFVLLQFPLSTFTTVLSPCTLHPLTPPFFLPSHPSLPSSPSFQLSG